MMDKRYTEGIAFEGVVFLDHGRPMTITEVLNKLNELEQLKQEK